MASTSSHTSSGVSTLGSTGAGFIGMLTYKSMSVFKYTLENPLPLQVLGLSVFNHLWTYKMRDIYPPVSFLPVCLCFWQMSEVIKTSNSS